SDPEFAKKTMSSHGIRFTSASARRPERSGISSWMRLAPVILGVVFGAIMGTRVLVRLTNQTVRHIFLGVLLVLGVQMLLRGILGV
ncbi:MAG: hypothetical protein MUP41_16015, partial [Desulfobacterales bacterium]|nr:hypothetical protein [Desulfobacterales bacterium]